MIKKHRLFLTASAMLLLCFGWTWWMVKLTDKKLREDLLLHARVLCASMDLGQDISSDTILFNPEKIKELKLEKRFRNVLKEIPECSFISLVSD
jgi:hypothetical protein